MSLFKSRVWWEVNLNENEVYDSQCILILQLEKEKNHSILLGNHEGLLRLFSPWSQILDEGVTGFKPSHLLLEVQLSSPILQINEGTLVSGSQNKYLAVLHPRLFSVYALKKKETKECDVGDEMVIELAYQHVLRHSAHSFVLGPFGGVRGRTFTCIQSLDGLLSFYEQESFAFQLYLPSFILPFNFTYLSKIDSFLFLNSLMTLDCYSYESLASAGNSNDKKVMKTWEYNLGEEILEMKTVLRNGLVIIILSDRNLYGFNKNGKINFMKRLEYKPVTFCCYVTEEEKRLMIIIVTDGKYINLYEETRLKWSMKIDQIPVSIDRIFLSGLPGGIVILSENGYLQVVYIGTHPSIYLIPPLVRPEIDYRKSEIELKQLQQKIADNDLVDPLTADLVGINLKIDKNFKIEKDIRLCNVMVEISTQCPVGKIQAILEVEPPLVATNQVVMISNCSEKTFFESSIYLNGAGVVSSLLLRVIVTYTINQGVARFIQKEGLLPLGLVMAESTALKEAQHKITISTNKSVCGINQLFREFVTEENSPHVIGLKFLNSQDVVTVLAAKSSQRYRLQSDSLAAISLLLIALIERLKIYYRKDSDFSLTYSTPLPLDIFFEKITHHHKLLKELKALEENLSKQNSQYRTIQKKVLTSLKDVTPKPPSNLHMLLKNTFQMISCSLEELEKIEKELFLSRCCLSSLNRLLVALLELKAVGDEDLKYLKVVYNPCILDSEKQGWLEIQEAAASFLLRTTLAKSTRDQQKPTEILLKPITDTSKLAKHFSAIIDRVTKGTHLLERNEFENKMEPMETIQADPEEDFVEETIPAGSRFVALDTPKNIKPNNEKIKHTNTTTPNKETNAEKEAVEEIKEIKLEVLVESLVEPQQEDRGEEAEVKISNTEKRTERIPEEEEEEEDDDAIWDVKIEEMRI